MEGIYLIKDLKRLGIDSSWTLFLDRDGVINKRIERDYVREWSQFKFLPNTLDALRILKGIFGRIIVVTNQRGIGRNLMTYQDLQLIHANMLEIVKKSGGRIDAVYYCPHDYEKGYCLCRKPNVGMAIQAKKDFPDIDFSKSVMVGDSLSDMDFGKRLGMVCVFVGGNVIGGEFFCFESLYEFAICLKEICLHEKC